MNGRRQIATLVAIIALICAPSAAHAGDYDVLACDAAASGVNRTWAPENSDGAHMETATACPSSGSYSGLYTRTRLGSAGTTPGSRAQWVSAPQQGRPFRESA
jgi:hypothetical protein